MHLAEPRLLWRVKQLDGTWKYIPCKWVVVEQVGPNVMAMIALPAPPVETDETENESDGDD